MRVSVVEGSGQTLISGNVVDGAQQGAVVGYRWNDRVGGALSDGDTTHPHLTLRGNVFAGG